MNDNTTTTTTGNGQAVLRIPINMSGLQQTTTRADDMNAQGRPKRKQVKNACVNCQKACKKCDDGRPCQRCIRYNLQDTCVNSQRKERRKGVKRGPYKKRGDDGSSTGYELPQGSSYSTHPPLAQYNPYATMAFQEALNGQPPSSQFMAPYTSAPAMHAGYNNMLSYQAVMSMISPGSTPNMYHPSSPYYYQQQQQQQPASSENVKDNQPGSTTTSSITTSDGDQDDETSKLNLLSQLCTAALDRLSNDQQEGETSNNNTIAKDNQ